MAPTSYVQPGKLTELSAQQVAMVRRLDGDPEALCRVIQGLVIQPPHADGAGLSEVRLKERNLRPATALLERVTELDAAPICEPRPPDRRVVGTCRHFAVMSCALLRASGIPARARCGFATYFVPGTHVDHWVTEYWSNDDRRWVRVDSEILGLDLVRRPHDLADGEFLTGGEAWQLCRGGDRDAMTFGVHGTDHAWGPAEIRGNAIRDLAALNKVEMLPWDEWGPMEASYQGETGPEFDELIDDVADVCASEDPTRVQDLYDTLRVPDEMIS